MKIYYSLLCPNTVRPAWKALAEPAFVLLCVALIGVAAWLTTPRFTTSAGEANRTVASAAR